MFVMLEMSLRCTATPTHPYREESMKLCKALLAAVPRKPLTQLQRQNHGGSFAKLPIAPSYRHVVDEQYGT